MHEQLIDCSDICLYMYALFLIKNIIIIVSIV